MKGPDRSQFAVRARRLSMGLMPLLVLGMVAGCRHHRSAYRPVYGRSPVAVEVGAPCPSGDCGGGASVLAPEPGFSGPATITPPASPLGPESLEPISPVGGGAAEPGLEGAGMGTRYRPKLEPPQSTRREETDSGRPTRRAVGGRRAMLRRNVQAYVNDTQDLFTPPRADRPWRYIVIHHSAHAEGSLAQLDRDHRERLGTAGCGYHFVVGNGSESPDGTVEVAQRWSEQKAGAHCRDSQAPEANDYGIGICLVGNLDDAPPTDRQVAAARALVAYLQDRYAIPAPNVQIHSHLARTATSCPGRHFPTQAILADLDRSLAAR